MTDILQNALCCSACIVVAHAVSHMLLAPCADTTTWFGMHVIVNVATAWYAFPYLVLALRDDPRIAIAHPAGHD